MTLPAPVSRTFEAIQVTFMKLHLCVADLNLGTLNITSNTKTAIYTVGGRASFKERPRIEVTRASTRGMCQMCVFGVFRLVDGPFQLG